MTGKGRSRGEQGLLRVGWSLDLRREVRGGEEAVARVLEALLEASVVGPGDGVGRLIGVAASEASHRLVLHDGGEVG